MQKIYVISICFPDVLRVEAKISGEGSDAVAVFKHNEVTRYLKGEGRVWFRTLKAAKKYVADIQAGLIDEHFGPAMCANCKFGYFYKFDSIGGMCQWECEINLPEAVTITKKEIFRDHGKRCACWRRRDRPMEVK